MHGLDYFIFLTYLFKFNAKYIIKNNCFFDYIHDDNYLSYSKEIFLKFFQKSYSEDDFDQLYVNALNDTLKTLNYCLENNIEPITIFDTRYPRNLMNLIDPPIVLYCKGDASILNNSYIIAVVGTRKPTPNGKKAALRFGSFLGDNGVIVVSGLAVGCDTQAHLGCLDAGGKTIAVLASGLDEIYPKENAELAEKIVDTGGCLISEYPPTYKLSKANFVKRDRIESGLSSAVIIVEAPLKSGTMHTANYALMQNRLLGAYLHSFKEFQLKEAEGNRYLIDSQKAIALRSSDQIIDFMYKAFNVNGLYSNSLFDCFENRENFSHVMRNIEKNKRNVDNLYSDSLFDCIENADKISPIITLVDKNKRGDKIG
ncbi:MAG: DNA-processing protein DprA [Acidaminococcaceae bacterium]